jgi:hypothetical protein
MGQSVDLQEARRRLGLALELLCHDRWVLGHLRGGSLQPIAASEVSKRLLRTKPLLPLARRALYEHRPLVVNSIFPYMNPSSTFDWELDWPAILYVPVGDADDRPVGLLVLGCRRDYWYSDTDVDYAKTLGIVLAPLVAQLRGPLGRMNEAEAEVAQLISCGMSAPEIAHAIKSDPAHAQSLMTAVTRKLNQRTVNRIPVCVW